MSLGGGATFDLARKELDRLIAAALGLDIDWCANTYGVAPCTASAGVGNECYQCYFTCQDIANFSKTIKTIDFINRGAPIPPGELNRPYILLESIQDVPTEVNPDTGLAPRGELQLTLTDEVCEDYQLDPYHATRANPAGGTFLGRLLARHRYLARRPARWRRGYPVTPWSWDAFVTAHYVIHSFDGPHGDNTAKITLKDRLSITERTLVPPPTNGALQADLKAFEDQGTAQAGAAATVTLRNEASAIDGYYVDMSVRINSGTGAGQEGIITDYVGATRVATVSVAWAVQPDGTSQYDVGVLKIGVGDALANQYNKYGTPCRIAIGDEVILIDAINIVTNELSWTSLDNRAQDDTVIADHKTGDNVQLCKRFDNVLMTDAIKEYATESGLDAANIDSTYITAQDDLWLGDKARITITRTKPEKADKVIATLSLLAGGMTWYENFSNKMKFKVNAPPSPGDPAPISINDESGLVHQSIKIKRRNDLQRTRAAVYYDGKKPNAGKSAENYLRGALYIDQIAEGSNAYDNQWGNVLVAEWLGAVNSDHVAAWLARWVAARADPPVDVSFNIDPKDYDITAGDLADITTDKLPDLEGNAKTTRVLVTRTRDRGKYIEVKSRATDFSIRYLWFSLGGTADYPTDKDYGHFCEASGLMSDGTSPYVFF